MSTKVFVGNLAFRVTDQDLQGFFSENCKDVKSGVVITRGRRSLGFGFVEFNNTESANGAVNQMNQKELFGREIKVELAKDVPDSPPRQPRNEGNSNSQPRSPSNRSGSQDNERSGERREGRGGRRGGRGRGRGGRGRGEGGRGEGGRDGGRSEGGRSEGGRSEGGRSEGGRGRGGGGRRPRNTEKYEYEEKETKPRIPSTTTLFVSNLPFSFRDEDLTTVFQGLNAKEAHVALTRNGRSRRYGFVEFETEKDQQDALAARNNHVVVGQNGERNIAVSIANSVTETQE